MSADATPAILLTWNPIYFDPDSSLLDDFIAATHGGSTPYDAWSTGNRKGGVPVGARAYLLRQGIDRGIVASGRVTQEVFGGPNWREDVGGLIYFVGVEWEIALPIERRLKTETLEAKIPGIQWRYLQRSGVMPDNQKPHGSGASPVKQLARLWDHHVANA